MKVVQKKIDELKYAPYNPRKISPDEYEKLKKSIEKFGLVEPLVWNKRTKHVVGGNQRLKVLKDLGFTIVNVVEVDLDLETEKALNLALNKISGEWDLEKLEDVLRDLKSTELIDFTGFELEEIEEILQEVDLDEFFREPEEDEKPRVITHTCPNCGAVFTSDGTIIEFKEEQK